MHLLLCCIMSKFKYIACALLFLEFSNSLELPNSFIDIYLGQTYKDLKQKYQLKRVTSNNEILFKTYKIIYNEAYDVEILVYFFRSKVTKISIRYGKNFLDENDWENIYNQALTNYEQPKKIFAEMKNNTLKQYYFWEDEKVEQTYICVFDEKENLQNFYIILTDKISKQKIQNLSPIRKLYYKLLKLFF